MLAMHEAMGLPDTTKLDDVSGDTTPMEGHLSTSDKEHTSDSRYQHWMSEDDYGRPGSMIESTWIMQHKTNIKFYHESPTLHIE